MEYTDPQYQLLQQRLTNACTSEEVQEIRQEAFYKRWYAIVNEGRQILLMTFGWKKGPTGILIPPTRI